MLRKTLLPSTLLALLVAPSALAAPLTTIVVLPIESEGRANTAMTDALLFRAVGTLRSVPTVGVVHPKMSYRVADTYEGRFLKLVPRQRINELGNVLGAKWAVWGTLDGKSKKAELTLHAGAVGSDKHVSAKMSDTTATNVAKKLPAELIGLLVKAGALPKTAGFDPTQVPKVGNGESLEHLSRCARSLLDQPLGIREPVVLDRSAVNLALESCQAAIRADPSVAEAKAMFALALALSGDRGRAEKFLRAVKSSKHFIPAYWIAKYWILARYYDPELAVSTLNEAIAKQPGFLLARGYLGDTLSALGRYAEAEKVFRDYLEVTPDQPWVMGRIGYALAKQDKDVKSIEWTRRGLRIAPADAELLLEMASRFIDAGQYKEASTILRRIIADGSARGEVHLRLGFAYLMLKQPGSAEREFHKAIRKATGDSEWRTRGRARYDLAKLWMKTNNTDNALRQLRMAVDEGYRDVRAFERDPDLKKLAKNKTFKKLMKKKPRKGSNVPSFVSPFSTDASGQFDGKRSKKKKKKITF